MSFDELLPTRASRWLLGLGVAGLFLWSLGSLLDPSSVLAGRDQLVFHLPLRGTLAAAAAEGHVPRWTSRIGGGQPVLSNPNYAAFYPPTWLLLVVSPSHSIAWLVVGHVAWALWGSWLLLRRLGAGPGPATAGALSFSLAPWFLGLGELLTTLCGMSWWPWVVLAGLAALQPGASARSRRRSTVVAAAALALQLLAGEPVTVLLTAVSLGVLALGDAPRLERMRRLVGIGAMAALLGSVQLLPTVHRLLDSARAGGTEAWIQSAWSMPVARLPEIAVPRLWGDPARDAEGLYFGRRVNDRAYPYLPSLYVGLPMLILALSGAVRRSLPMRGAWVAVAVLGLLLGLGRHMPVLGSLAPSIPLLNVTRFPERFVVLTCAAASVLGALALEQLLRSGHHVRLPIALAGMVTAAYGSILLLLGLRPDLGAAWVRHFGVHERSAAWVVRGVAYLRDEAAFAAGLSGALLLLLLLLVGRRAAARPARRRLLALPFVLLLCLDLAHYSPGLLETAPRELVLVPPRIAEAIPAGSRIVNAFGLAPDPMGQVGGRPFGLPQTLASLERLEPHSGNLWGLSYALNGDFDHMATSWARHARLLLAAVTLDPPGRRRLVAAWGARYLVEPRSRDEILADLRDGREVLEARLSPVAAPLPWARSVVVVETLGSVTESGPWLTAAGWDVSRRDTCIAAGPNGDVGPRSFSAAAVRVGEARDGDVRLAYEAAGPAYLVVAETFDEGWTGRVVDRPGQPLDVCPTAMGQIGFAVPAGRHEVRLRYRDPWVPMGAATTLITLLGLAWLELRSPASVSSRRPASREETTSPPPDHSETDPIEIERRS